MARTVKKCLQVTLKAVNATIGILGIAMILYGVWMIRVWERDSEANASDDDFDYALPWFIHAFLGVGIFLCGVTFLGHIAADTANMCCLSCYSIIIFLLLLFDAALIADVLLNSDWEKDLPDDPSGIFDDFKDFVRSNIHICEWVALFIFLAQGCSILIATVIKTLAADERNNYATNDEEYGDLRIPLVNEAAAAQMYFPTYVIGEPQFFYSNDDWKMSK